MNERINLLKYENKKVFILLRSEKTKWKSQYSHILEKKLSIFSTYIFVFSLLFNLYIKIITTKRKRKANKNKNKTKDKINRYKGWESSRHWKTSWRITSTSTSSPSWWSSWTPSGPISSSTRSPTPRSTGLPTCRRCVGTLGASSTTARCAATPAPSCTLPGLCIFSPGWTFSQMTARTSSSHSTFGTVSI